MSSELTASVNGVNGFVQLITQRGLSRCINGDYVYAVGLSEWIRAVQ
jgi:hypothetical protein